jgi:hypothetical protein
MLDGAHCLLPPLDGGLGIDGKSSLVCLQCRSSLSDLCALSRDVGVNELHDHRSLAEGLCGV